MAQTMAPTAHDMAQGMAITTVMEAAMVVMVAAMAALIRTAAAMETTMVATAATADMDHMADMEATEAMVTMP